VLELDATTGTLLSAAMKHTSRVRVPCSDPRSRLGPPTLPLPTPSARCAPLAARAEAGADRRGFDFSGNYGGLTSIRGREIN
jgi:hypothetical protein